MLLLHMKMTTWMENPAQFHSWLRSAFRAPPTSSISGVQPPSQEQGSGESGPPAEDQQLNTAKNARQPSSGSFANVPLCFQLLSSAIETKQTHTSNQHFPYSTLFSDFLQYKSYYKEIYLLSDVFGNMPTLPPVPELPLR